MPRIPANDDPAKKDTFVIAKNYEEEPSDAWDRQQTDYHDRYASAGGSSINSPYGYGMSDLNYYGNFMTVPGYGNVWQPYFIDAAWSPFQDGGWAFYPGFGYMWVSGYPWGWMPYNYGNWAFAPGFGWVWQPGYWNPWYGIPQVVNPPVRTKVPTAARARTSDGDGRTGPRRQSGSTGAPHRLTINPGSAGFGVPRGSVRHLDRVAKTMDADFSSRRSRDRSASFDHAHRQPGWGTSSVQRSKRVYGNGSDGVAAPVSRAAAARPHWNKSCFNSSDFVILSEAQDCCRSR